MEKEKKLKTDKKWTKNILELCQLLMILWILRWTKEDHEYHILWGITDGIPASLGSFSVTLLGPPVKPGMPSPRKTAMLFQLSR